jgi:hypothetical protein
VAEGDVAGTAEGLPARRLPMKSTIQRHNSRRRGVRLLNSAIGVSALSEGDKIDVEEHAHRVLSELPQDALIHPLSSTRCRAGYRAVIDQKLVVGLTLNAERNASIFSGRVSTRGAVFANVRAHHLGWPLM